MTRLLYFGLALPLSYLPMGALYLLSDGLRFLVFRVFGYRLRVVRENVARSFPEKSVEERAVIVAEFYRHFCDLVVESLKGCSISSAEIQRRFVCADPTTLDAYYAAGKPVVITGGHYNNWEWLAVALRQQIRHRAVAIYKPLSNRFLDAKMRETRGKYGLEMIPIRDVPDFFREAEAARTLGPHASRTTAEPYAMIFGIDQSPGDPRKAHWTRFLHQDTGVPYGAEKYAKEYDLPVCFGVIHKIRRGYYRFEIRPIADHPRETPHGWILEEASRLLEIEIRKAPPYWLWSHRRWKHAKPADLPEYAARPGSAPPTRS